MISVHVVLLMYVFVIFIISHHKWKHPPEWHYINYWKS